MGKKSYCSALFYNAKCYCHYERLFLCQKDVAVMFSIKGHVTMAANERIVDPFFKKILFFPIPGMGVL